MNGNSKTSPYDNNIPKKFTRLYCPKINRFDPWLSYKAKTTINTASTLDPAQ